MDLLQRSFDLHQVFKDDAVGPAGQDATDVSSGLTANMCPFSYGLLEPFLRLGPVCLGMRSTPHVSLPWTFWLPSKTIVVTF